MKLGQMSHINFHKNQNYLVLIINIIPQRSLNNTAMWSQHIFRSTPNSHLLVPKIVRESNFQLSTPKPQKLPNFDPTPHP